MQSHPERVVAPPESRTGLKRLGWLLGCFAAGGVVGVVGSTLTGSDLWYLAIPVAVAGVWMFVANPTECGPKHGDCGHVRPGVVHSPSPKYSLPEIERRWLVETSLLGSLEVVPYKDIEDLYIRGTQLRLRKVTAPNGEVELKFCKKYGRGEGLAEAVTNLYLSPQEYEALAALPGHILRKRRYLYSGGALDVYAGLPLAIFEVEFGSEDEARRYVAPAFAGREVTGERAYFGDTLSIPTTPN